MKLGIIDASNVGCAIALAAVARGSAREIVSARIAEIVLRDECAAIPIGSYQHEFGVTLSLPSIVGHAGVLEVMQPELAPAERSALEKSAEGLRNALRRVRNQRRGGRAAATGLTQIGRLA
jgi:malate/lactate dehydrogenase